MALAVDGENVYWTHTGTEANNYMDGAIMKCPLSGCGSSPVILATGQNGPTGIAVDATSVYWTTFWGWTVMKLTPK